MKEYIIQLEEKPDSFIADFLGDPGRTHVKEWAKICKNLNGAKSALTQIRKIYNRKFLNAKFIEYVE